MTNEYELSGPTREGLIFEKQDLLAPMGKNMLAAPHPMVPGTMDGSYYRGEVTAPVDAQVEWVRENRPEDPTLPENKKKNKPADEEYVPRTPASNGDTAAPAGAMGHSAQGRWGAP